MIRNDLAIRHAFADDLLTRGPRSPRGDLIFGGLPLTAILYTGLARKPESI